MSDIGRLLGRIGPRLFQQSWVVADLDAAKQAMTILGCGPFVEFRMAETWQLRGQSVPGTLGLAFARSGNAQIELMQPLEGEGIHFEFHESKGSGPHHLGFLVDDLDHAVEAAAEDGFPVAMAGQFGSVRISYLDTLEELGLYLELIQDPDGMLWAMAPWRDERP